MKFAKIFVSIIVLFVNACKPTFPLSKKERSEMSNWTNQLNQSEGLVKAYWVELIDDRLDFFRQYKIAISIEEIKNMKMFPGIIFTIDSIHIFNFNANTILGKELKMDKINSVFYGFNIDTIRVAVYPKFSNKLFENGNGYSNIFPQLGAKLFYLNNKGYEIYQLNVIPFPTFQHRLKGFIFYVNKKGEFLSLQPDGSELNLKEELLKLKDRAIDIRNNYKF